MPNKRELQQIAININRILTFKTMNLHKKCNTKPYSFLMIGTTLASDNPSPFRENLLEKI